jgi:cation transport ATPase
MMIGRKKSTIITALVLLAMIVHLILGLRHKTDPAETWQQAAHVQYPSRTRRRRARSARHGEAIRFQAVLVIATPCPLLHAIASPTNRSISLCLRRAIFVRSPVVLKRSPSVARRFSITSAL